MTEQAASQASLEGRSCSRKTRNLSSIPPNRATLVNHAKRAVFQGGFVWLQTRPEGASVTMSSQGDDSRQAVSGYLTGQLFQK